MAEDNRRQQLRNAAIVAFMSVVAGAVVVNDETSKGKVSVEEFLETFDQCLDMRLKQPGGAELEAPVRSLCDMLRLMIRRKKSRFVMKRAIDEIFDDIDDEVGL